MTASSPAPRTTILRPDDLLLLDFDFVNIALETTENGARLVPVLGNKAYIIVHFPPQNIAEEAFFETNNNFKNLDAYKSPSAPNDPDGSTPNQEITSLPLRSLMSGPSQLVFEVPDSVTEIPYTIQGLLDWSKFSQRVAPTALPPLPPDQVANQDRPAIQEPS
jgi:hypothetical protein